MGLKGRSSAPGSPAMTDKRPNHWKVIYTASRQEKKVAERFEKSSIEFYLPIVKQLKLWSDRKKWVEVPLFNGYLFVRPAIGQRDKVLETPGVVRYLRYNGNDAYATETEIETIRNLLAKGYDVSEYDGSESFEQGDKVKVVSGPMKNYEGEILGMSGDNYAFMSIPNFGHSIKIKLPKQVLKKVEG